MGLVEGLSDNDEVVLLSLGAVAEEEEIPDERKYEDEDALLDVDDRKSFGLENFEDNAETEARPEVE